MSDLERAKIEAEEELEEASEASSEEDRLSALRERSYRFVRSFEARLVQSSDEVRYYYSEIKNELLTYKATRIRKSWNHEMFFSGRQPLVRMKIRGKSLLLYLPLEVSEVSGLRFSLEEAGESLKNQKTPSLFRVNSPSRLSFARELVAMVMAKYDLDERKDPLPEKMDFGDLPYESTENLLNDGKIRLELRVGATPRIIYLKKPEDEEEEGEEKEKDKENEENPEEEAEGFRALSERTYSFERSFAARLSQGEEKLKFFYLQLRNGALKYAAARSRRSFSHEWFTLGRPVIMRLQIRGKTISAFFPLKAEDVSGGRYGLEEAPKTKKNEKTPSVLRITSQGKLTFALKLIDRIVEEAGRADERQGFIPEDESILPYETTETLLNKNLVRLTIRKDEYPPDLGGPAMDEEAEDEAALGAGKLSEEEEKEEKAKEEKKTEEKEEEGQVVEPGDEFVGAQKAVFDHIKVITRERADRLSYEDLLKNLEHGEGTFEYRKRYLLRAIDENWVTAIEEMLPIIDKLTRNPGRIIEENEEILPIERSRRINQRSVVHLSQHVNMVSKVENGFVTPNKILNVFYDETIKTYENKFLNTLLMRLFVFVNKRYELAKNEATDEVRTSVDFRQAFKDDDSQTKGKIRLYMELSEKPKDILILKNYTFTTDLWKRVERLNQICFNNINSDFARQMEKAYVRPPIMRTNGIMKNKDFKQCLLLWQYIEGYENAGYELVVQEELKRPKQEYLQEFCRDLTDQYLSFVHMVREGKDDEETLDRFLTDKPLKPVITSQLDELTREEFDLDRSPKERRTVPQGARYRARRLNAYEKTVAEAIEVALEADRIMKSPNREQEIMDLDREIGDMSALEFSSAEEDDTKE